MRKLMIIAVGGLFALTAGCARTTENDPAVASAQNGAPNRSASPSVSAGFDPDAPLKFAKCMREQGMTWFPDPPAVNQEQAIHIPGDVKPEDFDAAQEACKQYAPTMVDKGGPNPADIEKLRNMAKCMRENGVPDFPDPKADGSSQLGDDLSHKPGDPIFDNAEKACEKYMPEGTVRQKAGGPVNAGGGGK